jgi:hypothetical protein
MTVGTDLLVQIFEAFTIHNTPQKIMRRLYCESGHPARKAYGFVDILTKQRLGEIIPKCRHCRHSKLQHRTIVLLFEELTKINKPVLLKEMYIQIGGPSRKAYLLCNQKTQSAIQKLGLQKMYVKGKS